MGRRGDLFHSILSLRKKWWVLLLSGLATLPPVLYFNHNAVPLYESEATLTFKNLSPNISVSPEGGTPPHDLFITNRARTLLSGETAQELWPYIPPAALGTLHRRTGRGDESWLRYQQDVHYLRESISISPAGDAESIDISVMSCDPDLSNAILSASMRMLQYDAYFYTSDLSGMLRSYLRQQILDSEAARNEIERRLEPLQEKQSGQIKGELIPIVEAMIALQFSQQQDAFNSGVRQMILGSLVAADSELLSYYRQALDSTTAHSTWQNIFDAQNDYTNLFTEQIPDSGLELLKLTRTIAQYKLDLCGEIIDSCVAAAPTSSSEVSERMKYIVLMLVENDFNHVRNQINAEKTEELRSKLGPLPEEAGKYVDLIVDINVNASIIQLLQSEITKYSEDASWTIASLDMASLRWATSTPVRPRKVLNMAFGFGVGIILSLLVICAAESLHATVHSAEELASITGTGDIATLHFSKVDYLSSYNRLVTLAEEDTPLNREYRQLAASFKRMSSQKSIKSLLMIAPDDREINATILTNVAIALAEEKLSTLLIDLNVQHPSVHTLLGTALSPGVTDLVAVAAQDQHTQRIENQAEGATSGKEGDFHHADLPPAAMLKLQVSLLEMLQKTQIDNLLLLTSGAEGWNSTEVIESAYLPPLFRLLRSRFEHVIINSPPLQAVGNGRLLFAHVDGVMLLIEPAEHNMRSVRAATARIATEGGTLAGVVVIDV